jgi:hypothetical protein
VLNRPSSIVRRQASLHLTQVFYTLYVERRFTWRRYTIDNSIRTALGRWECT